ncbi:hypothetical protein [Rummeliibacillus stabekisii]|uniref:hypothetical protein n=1 Tax=Rummeliibacillus stabekisii TaxID=241244 RepID=UPI0016087C47|nr:hypothetical protein [Rummeliibacillus stabekisii]MBB5171214.1 Ca2+-binding EF-hand superfamily protein [Rummeliibacillus stabekisii]
MNKKKLVGYVMSGALSVGVLSGIGSNVYAKTMSNSSDSSNTTQEQIQKIKAELKSKLAKLGVSLPEPNFKNSMLANLDDATKKKAQAILDKEKNGSLSHEEAQKQLKALGINFPEHPGKGKFEAPLDNLDAATKKKALAILDKEKDGSLSHEEAQKQLKALGINFPEHPGKGKFESLLDNLDAATKKKALAILDKEKDGSLSHEEAQNQLKAFGVNFPEHPGKGKFEASLDNLDAATKKKALAILDKEKDGSLSHEEAQKQLKAFGVNFPEHPGKGKFESLLDNLDAATKKKALAILDKEKDGSLSHEEAQKQLKALGVNFPDHPKKRGNKELEKSLDKLDEKTKQKAQKLIDQAQEEIQKLDSKR